MLAGLAVLGAAGWNVWRGLSRKFKKSWHTEQMGEQEERVATGVGVAGHLARGVTFALIGTSSCAPPGSTTRQETVGLDGALAKLARADYGPWLLGLTAVGLDLLRPLLLRRGALARGRARRREGADRLRPRRAARTA